MKPNVDDLLQRGLTEHRWDAVIEALREGGDENDDSAVVVLDRLRAEVRELFDSLVNASSVREVKKLGQRLNERIDMMKGLESALQAELLAARKAG